LNGTSSDGVFAFYDCLISSPKTTFLIADSIALDSTIVINGDFGSILGEEGTLFVASCNTSCGITVLNSTFINNPILLFNVEGRPQLRGSVNITTSQVLFSSSLLCIALTIF